MNETSELLREAYGCIAELWCSPGDIDLAPARQRAAQAAAALDGLDPQAAASLREFLCSQVGEDEYIELFELDPRCALYLGSHVFDEPKTCAGAGLSERNGYMIELRGIYGHLGLAPNGKELPDYLPLMVECLALSAPARDPVRAKLIEDYMLPYLKPMRAKLGQLQTPYAGLLDALERVMRIDLRQAKEVSRV